MKSHFITKKVNSTLLTSVNKCLEIEKFPPSLAASFEIFEMVFPFHLDSDRLLGTLNESNFTEGDPIWKAMGI